MLLSRFLEWEISVRSHRFPGRFFLGALYRFLLYRIFDPLLRFTYRIRIAWKTRRIEPFHLSGYRLIQAVRLQTPTPLLIRRWCSFPHPISRAQCLKETITRLHSTKYRTPSAPWLLPETVLLAPALDCKGFAVLLSSLLSAVSIPNEFWIGLPSDGRNGHAWIVVETEQGRIAVDQFNGMGVQESLYRLLHPYALTLRLDSFTEDPDQDGRLKNRPGSDCES